MSRLSGEAWIQSGTKRRFDIVFAIAGAPVVAPFALAALAAHLASEWSNPFFTQKRIGRQLEEFTIYKLKSMPEGTAESKSSGHYDERATQLGKILRVSRIDEIPQLANVVKGEMSVVGPRPLVRSHMEEILDQASPRQQKAWLAARAICRPGMFDPHAVDIYIHDAPDSAERRAESDIRYASDASMRGDIATIVAAAGFYGHLLDRK